MSLVGALLVVLLLVAVAVAGVYLAGVGPFPPTPPPSAPAAPASTFWSAEYAADDAALAEGPGPWTLVFASAQVDRVPLLLNTSVSGLFSGFEGAHCADHAVGNGTLIEDPADTGNLTTGQAPEWSLLYANASGYGVVVNVVLGAAQVSDIVTGCGAVLHLAVGLPLLTVDSPEALASAMAPGGYAFLSAHPGGNLSLAALSTFAISDESIQGAWFVEYSTCPITSTASPTQEYWTYSATVGLTAGSSTTTKENSTFGCPSSVGPELARALGPLGRGAVGLEGSRPAG